MIELLRKELTDAGIVADAERRRVITGAITNRGWAEFDQLCGDVGLPMECVERSVVASLGMGAAVTEFATAGIGLAPEFAGRVAALGALSNVIVSAFDAIVDAGGAPPQIDLGGTVQPEGRHGNLKRRILARLVELYYRRLNALPQENVEVRSLIDRSIRRMYAAELQSAGRKSGGRSVWWRKNVLPFVVTAAPGWLTIPRWTPERFLQHLRWLCRLGEFLGWVDDCVDLSRDESLGQSNRVGWYLASGSEAGLARRVAAQGHRILREWDAANGPSPVRDTFAVIVWSWIDSGAAHRAK